MSWYDTFNPFANKKGIGDPGGLFQTAPDTPQIQGGYYNQAGIDQAIQGGHQNAPQMDASQQAQFRQMQMNQAMRLQGIASGTQQGAGELAVQRQVANAQAAQQAQARMARGGNAGMANLQASRAQAGIGLQGAGQSQQAALSDQQMAQGQLANSLNQGRSGDMSLAQGNANLQQQQYSINDQAQLGYLSQMTGMGRDQLALQTNQYNTQTAQDNQMKGGMMAGIGAAIASDERLKTGIKDSSAAIDELLDTLKAKTYRYKDEAKYGKGERVGVMVQDLAKSKAGKALVVGLPDGDMKGFDVNKAVSLAIASTARLNERLRKLEGKSLPGR